MVKPVLVVMAAGMGSRYGGPKQIDPVGKNGEIIIDFSLFDAKRAGFEDIVFIIKKDMEKDFGEAIGDRISSFFNIKYAYQELDDLPEGFSVPEGREKPYGTAHAVRACRGLFPGSPFAVINADDYYGAHAFKLIYDHLAAAEPSSGDLAMVGYILENTLTDHGHVARGVCEVDDSSTLVDIHERTHIEKRPDGTAYTEDGETWHTIPKGSIVSMNLWGFTPMFMEALREEFPKFLKNEIPANPKKAEFFLPSVVDTLIKSGKATVKVLKSEDRWYGVTYREDKPVVVEALAKMHEAGLYPDKLWEK